MNDMNTNFSFGNKRNEGLTIFGVRGFKFEPENYITNNKPMNNDFNENSNGMFILHGMEKMKFTQNRNNLNKQHS